MTRNWLHLGLLCLISTLILLCTLADSTRQSAVVHRTAPTICAGRALGDVRAFVASYREKQNLPDDSYAWDWERFYDPDALYWNRSAAHPGSAGVYVRDYEWLLQMEDAFALLHAADEDALVSGRNRPLIYGLC